MRSVLAWSDKVPERNGEKFVVQDIAFRPDGTQLVAAIGTRVMVYDAIDGTLLHSLKGHKGIVYTVDYSHDGKRFASGGADNVVIIWTDKAEGILKYTHNDSIQKLVYNPQSQCLASCTISDFGLWAPEQKRTVLALGLLNGLIAVRGKQGNEKQLIERPGPVWTLAWSISQEDNVDVLAVGCWDRTLLFYNLSGALLGKPRALAFNPTSITYFRYYSLRLCLLTLHTDFVSRSIADLENWVWAIKARPKTNFVAVGCEDGSISVHCLVFGTVHGIYQERYAYRENITDVIVQHLMTEQKVRIRTRDCVKKLSVYRDRLAVQLSDKITIYELESESGGTLASRHELQFYPLPKAKAPAVRFSGKKEREWVMESLIRYIKVTGGAKGKEGLLVGLKDGSVWQIFINNPFPIPLIHQNNPISCLDISSNREKLAVVDDSHKCIVYDLATKEMLFKERDANSVAWNIEFEDMLCFAGNGQLKIKTGNFPGHTQRMQGFVVGFTGSKVFCLNSLSVQTIDVPQSAPLYRYLEQNEFTKAYQVSCLGVTEADWSLLAWEALKSMNFEIARKAFTRVRDVRCIELVNALEQRKKLQLPNEETADPEVAKKVKSMLQAEIMAYQCKFQLAAKLFTDCGEAQTATKMFADLRMWDDAKKFATQSKIVDIKQLVQDQAKWAEEVQDWRAAAEMYTASGNTLKAVEIMSERGWYDDLLEIAQKVDIGENKILSLCANYFLQAEKFKHARDVFLKIGDMDSLLKMHIRLQEPVRRRTRGVRQGQTSRPLLEIAAAAHRQRCRRETVPRRVALPLATLRAAAQRDQTEQPKGLSEAEQAQLAAALENEYLSEIYYAYAMIYSYTDEPFTTLLPESLFHSAQFLINKISKTGCKVPPGVSMGNIYFTLGHHALQLETYKLARQAFEKLLQMKLRPEWQKQVDLTSMTLQTKPYSDKDELLPVDYRSSTTNPLLNPNGTGDVCVNSGHPFVRSFVSFENLPLVEFQPTPGLSDEEVEKLILTHLTDHAGGKVGNSKHEGGWKETDHGDGTQTMKFGDDGDDNNNGRRTNSGGNDSGSKGDLFDMALNRQASYGSNTGHRSSAAQYRVLQVDERVLLSLNPSDVFIVKYSSPLVRHKYYKNMIPEIKIHFSPHCRRFFHEEDFEFEYLKAGHCLCCRVPEMEALDSPNNNDGDL
ncbi:Intraflagellar transport protein, partial [Globisporangium splendens]